MEGLRAFQSVLHSYGVSTSLKTFWWQLLLLSWRRHGFTWKSRAGGHTCLIFSLSYSVIPPLFVLRVLNPSGMEVGRDKGLVRMAGMSPLRKPSECSRVAALILAE